jgi:hypothetical protein
VQGEARYVFGFFCRIAKKQPVRLEDGKEKRENSLGKSADRRSTDSKAHAKIQTVTRLKRNMKRLKKEK